MIDQRRREPSTLATALLAIQSEVKTLRLQVMAMGLLAHESSYFLDALTVIERRAAVLHAQIVAQHRGH